MELDTLSIENFGQINEAKLDFGDLTVLVGPQASGKSIALQLLKLAVDAGQIQAEMARYGIDWDGTVENFLDAYFGEGMRSLWKTGQTSIRWKGRNFDLEALAKRRRKAKDENIFFIPAQRVLALRDGWPRPFSDYSPGDPYIVRKFSDQLRVLVERETSAENLFPRSRRLKKEFRDLLKRDVFSTFSLSVDKVHSQKRLVMAAGDQGSGLPYMVWSAGQREFVPLLLGLYWLSPPSKIARRDSIEWVILEELEMGLHPRAISVVLMLVMELLWRGYRVCLSTHSQQVLDAVWTLSNLRAANAEPETILEVFDVPKSKEMRKLAEATMQRVFKVHYFDRVSDSSRDISFLDPSSDNVDEAGWGGLSEFSGRANTAVAYAMANS